MCMIISRALPKSRIIYILMRPIGHHWLGNGYVRNNILVVTDRCYYVGHIRNRQMILCRAYQKKMIS